MSAGRGYIIKPNVALFDCSYLNQYQGLTMLLFVYRVHPESAPEVSLTADAARKILERLHDSLYKKI